MLKLSFRFETFDKVTFYQSRFFHFHPTSFSVSPRLELLFFPWLHFFQIQLRICPHLNQFQFQLSFQSVAIKLSHVPKYKDYPRIIGLVLSGTPVSISYLGLASLTKFLREIHFMSTSLTSTVNQIRHRNFSSINLTSI